MEIVVKSDEYTGILRTSDILIDVYASKPGILTLWEIDVLVYGYFRSSCTETTYIHDGKICRGYKLVKDVSVSIRENKTFRARDLMKIDHPFGPIFMCGMLFQRIHVKTLYESEDISLICLCQKLDPFECTRIQKTNFYNDPKNPIVYKEGFGVLPYITYYPGNLRDIWYTHIDVSKILER